VRIVLIVPVLGMNPNIAIVIEGSEGKEQDNSYRTDNHQPQQHRVTPGAVTFAAVA
jgi:hypothetical protein